MVSIQSLIGLQLQQRHIEAPAVHHIKMRATSISLSTSTLIEFGPLRGSRASQHPSQRLRTGLHGYLAADIVPLFLAPFLAGTAQLGPLLPFPQPVS